VPSFRDFVALVAWAGAIAGCEARVTSVGAGTGPLVDRGVYLEAEDGQLSGGFAIGNDPEAKGGSFIEPPAGTPPPDQPGSANALYTFTVATPAKYVIWGRIHSPDATRNRLFVRIDAGTWYTWRIATGDIWYWDRIHDDRHYDVPLMFDLGTGPHELLVANAVDGVGLDVLYITSSGDVPLPNNSTPCRPPHSIEVGGICLPSCGSQGGNQCSDVLCRGRPIVAAYDCATCCNVP
jgi:hypothetical protein